MIESFISAYHGGLGDSLQFSTLPEELYKQKGIVTYIWDQAFFRNQEICNLVWGKNPYIKGIKSGKWNVGDTPEIKFENITGNCISNWEFLHGLNPVNKYPKIYYQPNKLDLSEFIIVDVSTISREYDQHRLFSVYENIRNRHPEKSFVGVRFENQINPQRDTNISNVGKHIIYDLPVDNVIHIESIFHYSDILASCFGLISVHSGQSHLSSAIKNDYNKKLLSYCIMPDDDYKYHLNKGLFIFDNINYITY